jgi:hypothetical protein
MTFGGSVGHKSSELPLIRGSRPDPQEMFFSSQEKGNLRRLLKDYEKKYKKNVLSFNK